MIRVNMKLFSLFGIKILNRRLFSAVFFILLTWFHDCSVRAFSSTAVNQWHQITKPTTIKNIVYQSEIRTSSVQLPRFSSLSTKIFGKASVTDMAIDDEETQFQDDIRKSVLWVLASIGFAGVLGIWKGVTSAVEFASGYVLEQSLSVDNLFVFLVLFDYFKVPKEKQERVLFYGLAAAVILRGIFIGVGYVALEQFHNILLLFAVILLASSYKILAGADDSESEDMSQNSVVQLARKFFRTTEKFDGDRFFTIENGQKLATPLFICLLCVEFSDVIFALDSVPAVFGVTEDPLVVFTSNIFAIASLRSVYGVLSKAVEQLVYLEKAVGIVLAIISVKMAAETFGITLLSPFQSLIVVLSVLGTGVLTSLYRNPKTVT